MAIRVELPPTSDEVDMMGNPEALMQDWQSLPPNSAPPTIGFPLELVYSPFLNDGQAMTPEQEQAEIQKLKHINQVLKIIITQLKSNPTLTN